MKYNLDIPGWMSERDLEVLNKLASYVPENGNILEIGCFVGRSTSALYYGKHNSVTLEVVDTFKVLKGYNNIADDPTIDGTIFHRLKTQMLSQITGSWLESFKFCMTPEVFAQLTVNVNTSRDYEITKHFDMVFIDANHDEEEVIYDIKKYSESENTLIVGDDFYRKWPGVATALAKVRVDNMKTLLVPEDSKIWILVPKSGYWKEVFQKNILF